MVRTEEILKTVPEEGTAVFKLSFKDETGVAVTPSTLYWDLTAMDGSVIAYNQQVLVLANPTYVPVFGAKLRIMEGEESYGERLITFRGKYNSSNGNDLPLHKQIKFRVQNLKLVGYPITVSVFEVAFTDDYVKEVEAV